MPDNTRRRAHVLPAELRLKLVELGRQLGVRAVAEEIGLHAQTIAIVAAGFDANPASVELIRRWITERR